MCVDGLSEGPVPIVDDTVDLWLNQQLCPLTSLQLRERRTALHFTKTTTLKRIKCRLLYGEAWQQIITAFDTSMTCFLLDLSLEAHSTDPPRRSTVNSGFDWLLPNFWNQGNRMRVQAGHKDDITGTRCCFRRSFELMLKKKERRWRVQNVTQLFGIWTFSRRPLRF